MRPRKSFSFLFFVFCFFWFAPRKGQTFFFSIFFNVYQIIEHVPPHSSANFTTLDGHLFLFFFFFFFLPSTRDEISPHQNKNKKKKKKKKRKKRKNRTHKRKRNFTGSEHPISSAVNSLRPSQSQLRVGSSRSNQSLHTPFTNNK